MDLSVKLVLRAQAEGTSAIRAMRQETAELATAMKEVREAARSGGRVSPSSIKALGGFEEFQKAFAEEQKRIAAAVGGGSERTLEEQERSFVRHIGRMSNMAKVRAAESTRVEREGAAADARVQAQKRREAIATGDLQRKLFLDEVRATKAATAEIDAAVARGEANQRRSMEETLAYNMRYWAARGRAAEQEARQEMAAARQRREAMRSMGLGMFAGSDPAGAGGGRGGGHGGGFVGSGGHGRGFMAEIGTAAEYTLTYGAINKVLEGVSAIARSPLALGRMTLGVADQAREIREGAADLGVSAKAFQDLRFAFGAKGLGEDRIQPMMQFMEKSAVGALRGIKSETVAFRALGISMKQLKADTHDPMKMLTDIGAKLEAIRNPAKRIAIADMIFGRDGSKYLSLFDHGFLGKSFAESERSGATMSDSDLAAGQKVSDQWKELKLEMAGIRNETAAAAFPIMGQLLGDASGWLRQNRGEISKIIHDDMAELKADLPDIERGFTNVANSILQMGRDFAPFVHAVDVFSHSKFAQYMVSGQIVPGGIDLGDAKHADQARKLIGEHALDPGGIGHGLYSAAEWAAHKGMEVAGQVHVIVEAKPGTSISSIRRKGNVTADVRRGQLGTGN